MATSNLTIYLIRPSSGEAVTNVCSWPRLCKNAGKLSLRKNRPLRTQNGRYAIFSKLGMVTLPTKNFMFLRFYTASADNCRPVELTVHELACLAQHAVGCKLTAPTNFIVLRLTLLFRVSGGRRCQRQFKTDTVFVVPAI